MQAISENTRGALLMTLSMAAFTLNDTCFKLVGKTLPLGQVLFLRGVMASLFLLLLARFFGVRWPNLSRKDTVLIAVRSFAEVGAAFFFLTALMNMPLANLTALLQMLPLTVTLGSALFFREAVGWRRWGAGVPPVQELANWLFGKQPIAVPRCTPPASPRVKPG